MRIRDRLLTLLLLLLVCCMTLSCTVPLHVRHPVSRGDTYYLFATFYGDDFDGRKTASGETFDMKARTCAVKEFPFGTLLEVNNIDSGRKTVVRVNDRPGANVIDLSAAAFSSIAERDDGRIRVRITVLGPADDSEVQYEKKTETAAVETESTLAFTVELRSFSEFEAAARFREKLTMPDSYIYADHGSWNIYRVRVGSFDSRSKADAFMKKHFAGEDDATVIRVSR